MMHDFRILLFYRWRALRITLQNRGWAQRVIIALFIIVGLTFFLGSLFLFLHAFEYGGGQPYDEGVIVRNILENSLGVVFFLGISSFLMVSFQLFFRSKEMRLLAELPVHPVPLFFYRLVVPALVSAWPVVFLGVPGVIALGMVAGARVVFYIAALFILVLFLGEIVVLGALLTFFLTPILRHIRQGTLFFLQIFFLGLLLFFLGKMIIPDGAFNLYFINGVAEQSLKNTGAMWGVFAFLPSRPFADLIGSMMSLNDIRQVSALFMGLVVVIFFFYVVLFSLVKKYYITMVQRHSETGFLAHESDIGPIRPRHHFPAIFKWRHGFLFEKDLLSFFRNPREMSRAFFLGSLLLFAIFTIRYVIGGSGNLNSLLLAMVFSFGVIGYMSLIFALRFVYPSLSVEKRSAWILWSSPVHIHEFFSWKLFFWSTLMLVGSVTVALVMIFLFSLPTTLGLFFLFAVINATCGIVALTLGQGSIFPYVNEVDSDVVTTTPSGVVTMILGGSYLFMIGRYVYEFALSFLFRESINFLAIFGIFIITLGVVGVYWVFSPRKMDSQEIA